MEFFEILIKRKKNYAFFWAKVDAAQKWIEIELELNWIEKIKKCSGGTLLSTFFSWNVLFFS